MDKNFKIIDTMVISGNVLEISKPRTGTKCKCCGRELYEIFDMDYTVGRPQEGKFDVYKLDDFFIGTGCEVCYVCSDCIEHQCYGSNKNADVIMGKVTKGNWRFCPEMEAIYNDEAALKFFHMDELLEEYLDLSRHDLSWHDYDRLSKIRLIVRRCVDCYLAAKYQFIPSHDSTVDVEYHPVNSVNFHGWKAVLEDISKFLDLSNDRCGHHLNISKTTWTSSDIDKIRWDKEGLFNPLMEEMEKNPIKTKKVFGRYFGRWANNDTEYVHGSWLNLDHSYRIEFRIPHFVNAKQYFYCCNYIRDITETVDKWLNGKYTTAQANKAMIRDFHKYAEGRATCQRPERNSK